MDSVYNHDREYAIAHEEQEVYHRAHIAKVRCRTAIDSSIHAFYSENRLRGEVCVKEVVSTYGVPLTMYVCAATIRRAWRDGRYSFKNKEWAKEIPICDDIDGTLGNRLNYYSLRAHPGLVDLFVSALRRTYPAEPENCILI